ncbi:hypothetical protein FBQ96_06160 [Nitrospirales bacterium NOB]|nr:hypothetical protein [Nitrospirales bacterium NOB]
MTSVTTPFNPNDGHKYVSDKDKFDSQEDMILHMNDPRYQNEQGYRDAVAKMIANSDAGLLGLTPPRIGDEGSDDVEIVNDWVKQTFGNPLYKTSAIYRRQVAEAVASQDYDHLIEGRINHRGGCTRVSIPSTDETGPNAPQRTPQSNPKE